MSKEDTDSSQPLNTLAKGVVDGTGSFLGRICLPAAEEFGLLLRDKVKHWRNKNFIKITNDAEKLISEKRNESTPNIHPRILHSIYENGSWSEEEEIQKMWSGLFASSCYEDGSDRSIFYVDILSKISKNEATIFNYVCKSSEWRITISENLVEALPVFTEPNKLKSITKIDNFEDIEESISHLQFLGLITHVTDLSNSKQDHYDSVETDAFDSDYSGKDGLWHNYVELSLTSLGIRLFLKAQGIEKRPSEYFKDKVPVSDDKEDFFYDMWEY